MYVRSAFWIGRPKAGSEAAFRTLMDGTLIPTMGRFPGVRSARALWPATREDSPPDIHCQILVEFDSQADVQQMLACPERAALKPRVLEAIALFEGSFSHIEYEVGTA
jgi:antibiotic biosynthesis monooxygenase (ABM) superfamily enzyme